MLYKTVRKLGGLVGSLVITVTGTELLLRRFKNGIRKAKGASFYKRDKGIQVFELYEEDESLKYLVYEKTTKTFYAPEGKEPYVRLDKVIPLESLLKTVLEAEDPDMLDAHMVIPDFRKLFNKLVKQAEPSVQGKTVVWTLPEIEVRE